MKPIACTISYGKTEIDYELLMMKRKSLEIAVYPPSISPDGVSVVVKAPISSSIETIEAKIRKRVRWIKKQIAYFNQFDPRTPERRYVGGESHLYLGRKYRLKIQKSKRNRVLLKNGYFYIECVRSKPSCIKDLLDIWYKQRAEIHLSRLFNDCWGGFKKGELKKPVLKLQKMKKRWGSLSKKGQLTLNTSLIQTPKDCIEYVIIHELCHLAHHNHSPDFYKVLERTMPDWIKRKHKLEMSLV